MMEHSSVPGGEKSGGRPVVIGLVGPIASGKSTVAAMLRRRGVQVIDADRVYRSLLTPGSHLSHQIIDHFGPAVTRGNGEIDRSALAEVVFRNPAALEELERITHPSVVQMIRQEIEQSPDPVIAVEAVKLVQAGLLQDVNALWHVIADPGVRTRRLVARSGLDWDEAQNRVRAIADPLPPDIRPDAVIDTTAGIESTERAVDYALNSVVARLPAHQGGKAVAQPLEER